MSSTAIAAYLTLVLSLSAMVINCYKIVKKQVQPTISMWLIFLVGTGLSLATYLVSTNKDFTAGALNAADVVMDLIVILVTVFFGATKWQFKSFEKYYLLGLLFAAGFWALTSNAFQANLLIQVILGLGYFPVAHNLLKHKRNSESFLVWGIILFSTLVSLYPAYMAYEQRGNALGLIYSGRSAVLIGLMMVLMYYYHRREELKNTHGL